MTDNSNYQAIIGLETHVQLKTRSKMFCSSPNNPDFAEPNTSICEVCTGQPGVLPVPNQEAIRKAVMVALALGCEIAPYSKFDRKNYFYPDLPKGYQISQYDQPIGRAGKFTFLAQGKEVEVRIRRVHLEEDTGRLLHTEAGSLVDFNRAGVPLLEIVTEPDFRSAEEVKEFLQLLRNLVRYLDASDGDMEKGHLRGEPNVSVRHADSHELPSYKVELKNLNSFRAVYDALNFEIERQTEALAAGERLASQTRGWDGAKTVVQRVKEAEQDYRYFPEPDLPILHFTPEFVASIRKAIPELPNAKEKRFIAQFGLPEKDAEVLVADKNLAAYFEEVVSELENWFSASAKASADRHEEVPSMSKMAKLASNMIAGSFQALLKEADTTPQDSKVTAENLAELIKMIDRGEISITAGKQVLQVMFERGGDPSNIVTDLGLGQVSDESEIAKAVEEVIATNEKAVADFRAGNQNVLGFLVGQVMGKMQGRANPQVVNKILRDKLS